MEKNYKLYALVDKNQPSEIRYIGQTRREINYRLSQHKRCKSNSYKWNWINKVGKENVLIITLIDNLSLEEANNMERLLIKECREIGYRLTNITDGGEGWKGMKLSETHRKKVSLNHADVSGDKNPMYGRTHTEQTLDKIRNAQQKWFENVGFSVEQIENMRQRSLGEKNNRAILTEDNVREIRKLSSEGVQNYILAKMFNMKVPAIWKIVNHYTWKHLV